MKPETAYFAGGCFWCITPAFREMEGVVAVRSGYSGGCEANPAYADVKHQRTGHRETIRVEYDADRVTFIALMNLFLESVDPFDGEGQFIDRGRSYTLAVYYTDECQREAAQERIARLEQQSGRHVWISLEPFTAFYDAEEEHQDYDMKHPEEFQRELVESGRIKA